MMHTSSVHHAGLQALLPLGTLPKSAGFWLPTENLMYVTCVAPHTSACHLDCILVGGVPTQCHVRTRAVNAPSVAAFWARNRPAKAVFADFASHLNDLRWVLVYALVALYACWQHWRASISSLRGFALNSK